MINGGLVALKTMLDRLKPSERKVAEYILSQPETAVRLSVQKLAELCGASESTVIRLTKTLNMSGFQELKLRIAGDINNDAASGSYQEIVMDGTVESIIQAVTVNNKQSIDDTVSVMSPGEMMKAAQILIHAKKVDIYGVGASGVIAQDLLQKLTRIKMWCNAYSDLHAQLTSAVNLTPGDVAFGISYSGQTEDVIQSLDEAKKHGATIITLTKFGSSPIADLGDVKLFVSSVEQSIRSGAMASRIAMLNVIDILFITLASQQHEKVINLLEKSRIAIRRTKRF
ncbi:MurR/RpiR family transcriptional regulator [Paenibacillus sp. RC67]|uniref:MurR/RpiR family transcriptional regulator n=1 Tax=Paenibacillus sp. RC67 TaxID=3039392 RepID=UPI0024ADDFB3|nr:MurR/RpiR family transcriptional regulator [Paenibacillus sp. RC67]